MDSRIFGVRFLFTAIGTILRLYWAMPDSDLRETNHYRLLLLAPSSSPATAEQTILACPPGDPFTGVAYSLDKKAWLSLVAILMEPLIVALANIPFQPGIAFMAYQTSTYFTIAVLSLMLSGHLGLLVRTRVSGLVTKRLTEAARDRSIGRVLRLICSSSMLGDFRGLSTMRSEEREEGRGYWGVGESL